MQREWNAYLNLSLAMIIVGSSVVFGKVIVKNFPVFLASGLRFAIASAVILPLYMKTEPRAPQLKNREWMILGIMAFCGQFIFTVLLLVGLKLTSAIEAGLITSTTPAAMTLVAVVFLRETLSVRQVVGVSLAVFGVLAVNGLLPAFSSVETDGRHLLGNLLVLGAVLGEAFFLLLRKTMAPALSSLAASTILCIMGCGLFLPFSLYQARYFPFSSVDAAGWWAILYFGAIFTVAAYMFWFKGVARVSGNTAGVFTALMPVSAVVLAAVFLNETITPSHGLGIVLVIAAIVLITTAEKRTRGHKRS